MEQEEELTIDPQYLKGFNNGYLLAKHEPELAKQLANHPNEHNAYFKGLVSGKEQYEKEALAWAKNFSHGKTPIEGRDLGKAR